MSGGLARLSITNKERSQMNKFLQAVNDMTELITGKRPKPKRARDKLGRYIGDDKSTKGYNEAWVGGKKPNTKQ